VSQHEIKEEEEGGDASDDADEAYVDVEGEEEEDDTLEADEDEVDPDEAEFEERAASTPKSGRLSCPLVRHSF
jgi:hypothetical protein